MIIYYNPNDEFAIEIRNSLKDVPHTEVFTPSSQKGVLNNFYGQHHTEESKLLIGANQKGWKHTDSAKEKIRIARLNVPREVSTRQKISNSNGGENHHMWGKFCSDDVKQKISDTKKNNPYKHNEERRRKISAAAKLREAKKRV